MSRCVFRSDLKRVLLAMLIAGATAMAQDLTITAQLNGPLSAGGSRKGDLVAAQVVSPDSLKGDTIQGMVTQTNSARGQSSVTFSFTLLRHGSMNIPITATIQGVSNAKGQAGVDDQGQALRASTAPGAKPVNASRFGGQLGGLIGGRTGQAVSDAGSDVNTSGTATGPMQISASGPPLELGTGSAVTVSVRSNNGPSLASLPPNAPVGAPAPTPQTMAVAGGPGAVSGSQPSATAASGGGSAQPELKSTKIEFVPGEKVVYFEDFSDMAEDEPPPHWKVRNGTVELRTGGGIRELYAAKDVNLTSGTFAMPTNFTVEIDWTGEGQMVWHFMNKDQQVMWAQVRGEPDGKTASVTIAGPEGSLGAGQTQVDTLKNPVHFALWAQQGRVRAYINGIRLVDVNQVTFGPMDHMALDFAAYRPNGLRQVRIAESAPDFSTMINATGKYVTHGINFDTDSDRLKPESGAMLKLVAAALTKNPNLKLEIDGYTDSVGKADHNLDLSRRRAQAVQSVLVSQFGVDADRLSSNGFGPDNPITSNDTPDGRANNRRVEFLKK